MYGISERFTVARNIQKEFYHYSMDKFNKYQYNIENDECAMIACYGNLYHTHNNYAYTKNMTEHKKIALLAV